MTNLLIPALLTLCCCVGLGRKIDIYTALQQGARAGIHTLLGIAPALMVLLSALGALRASGALEWLTGLLSPLCRLLGLPAELLPLFLIRPFSGSAALAVGAELMVQYGVDSQIGRTAAVMLGSSETTFYTVSVYFGAAGIRDTRHTIPAALCADAMGFFSAVVFTRLFFP